MSECNHMQLFFGVIDTVHFKYRQPTEGVRRNALTVAKPNKKRKLNHAENEGADGLHSDNTSFSEIIFPAPVTLPGHELARHPKYPPQPVKEWLNADYRNKVTPERSVIYVAAPPKVRKGLSYVNQWTIPSASLGGRPTANGPQAATPAPRMDDVLGYLRAFYHGMEVRLLENPTLEWVEWEQTTSSRQSKKKPSKAWNPDCIGLSNGKELIRIESRPSPDGVFSGQLNQNHLLEVAIDIVPDDSYALLMLVHHDLFEDEDDDFCCGRAYGGSRVAVVSTARYRPELDAKQEIDREHVWPASHCQKYVGSFFSNKTPAGPPLDKRHHRNAIEYHPGSAVAAAVVAHNNLPPPSTPSELSDFWLGRICKTASHELGHCFGIDHCVYWACSMQGTAHITEDHRQPPYSCPIDLAKVLLATDADVTERYEALMAFCDKKKEDRMFAAYAAWIRALLKSQNLLS